jgi:hypothetical protein
MPIDSKYLMSLKSSRINSWSSKFISNLGVVCGAKGGPVEAGT